MNRKKTSFLLIVLCIILLIIVFPSVAPELYWSIKLRDIENHAQWWSQLNITKYKIGVHFISAPLQYPAPIIFDCSEDLVVERNVVVETIQNDCGRSLMLTVDGLFSIIKSHLKSRTCSPEDCCAGPVIVDVVYDETYRFPKTAKSAYDSRAAWIFGPPWSKIFCMGMGTISGESIELETYSFVPIQP